MEWEVVVLRLAAQRRPAKEAAFLYEETKQSIERRAQEARRRKDERLSRQRELGRPSKRDRRRLASLKGR